MAYEYVETQAKINLVAGADLSALQYTFVKLNASGQAVAVSAINDVCIGVLQNAPTSGKTAEVTVFGITKVKASAVISLPAVIGTSTAGKSVTVVPLQGASYVQPTKTVLGQAITSASANNSIHTAFVNCLPSISA